MCVAEGWGMVDRFLFIRHGETAHNRAGLRCGGDVDIPLTEAGEEQARAAGRRLAASHPGIDVILAGPLQRTRLTAALVAESLAAPPIMIHQGLVERRLGDWNGRPIAETQASLAAGETPPGGEGEAEFRLRVAQALADILSRDESLPLLVGSKGVARIVALLMLGDAAARPLGNAEVLDIRVDGDARDRLAASLG